jgi:IS5 family transposase
MIFPASMGSLNCTSSGSHDVCYAGLGGKHPRSLLYTRARGRIVREVGRSIARRPEIEATLERPLARADQNPSAAPIGELECIGKGKRERALRIRRQGLDRHTNARPPGGQFVLHAKVLPRRSL